MMKDTWHPVGKRYPQPVLWIRFSFIADPDPAFYLNVDTGKDPDPASKPMRIHGDPDPGQAL
jgi:hypothetical protein